jgi:hypothetical protein
MGYVEALRAAGAEVHSYESFGDYQGTMLIHLTHNGRTGVVELWYGSCTHCDSYQAEFGWDDPTESQLAAFGASYLDDIQDPAVLLMSAKKDAEWDMEAAEKVAFLERILNGR